MSRKNYTNKETRERLLNIEFNGKKFEMKFNPNNTFNDLKKKCEEEFNLKGEQIKKELNFYIILKDKSFLEIKEEDIFKIMIFEQKQQNIILKMKNKEEEKEKVKKKEEEEKEKEKVKEEEKKEKEKVKEKEEEEKEKEKVKEKEEKEKVEEKEEEEKEKIKEKEKEEEKKEKENENIKNNKQDNQNNPNKNEEIIEKDEKYNDLEKKYNKLKEKYKTLKGEFNSFVKNRDITEKKLINAINKNEEEINTLKQKQADNEKQILNLLSLLSKNQNNKQENFQFEKTKNYNTPQENKKEMNNNQFVIPKEKENKYKTEIIKPNLLKVLTPTNPGILCEIISDDDNIPMILSSQINKLITFKLEIKNINNFDTPKNCKIIIKDKYEDCNIIIENPNINIIPKNKSINLDLKLKFIDYKKVKNKENYFELAVHTETYGLISKWFKSYIYLKDDSQNIEKKEIKTNN